MRSKTIVWTARGLLLFFLGALVFIILSADSGKMPRWIAVWYAYPGGDLLGHFLLMGLFSFLVNAGLAGRRVKVAGVRVLWGSLLVFVIVLLEEISQAFFSTRSASILDFACSLAGILFFGWLAERLFQNYRTG